MKRKGRCQGSEGGKRKTHEEKIFQILVKVPGSAVMILDATPSKTVEDLKQEVSSKLKYEIDDTYLTFEGKKLRWRDELNGCGILDGSTVQLTNKMRGGGVHKIKKPSKMAAKQQKQEGQASATGQVKVKKGTLEELCSGISDDVVQQACYAQDSMLLMRWRRSSARALFSRQEDEVDEKIKRILVEFEKACRLPPVLTRVGEIREVRGRNKEGPARTVRDEVIRSQGEQH